MKQTKNKHNEKVRKARRLQSRLEVNIGVPLFTSAGWMEHRRANERKNEEQRNAKILKEKYAKTSLGGRRIKA